MKKLRLIAYIFAVLLSASIAASAQVKTASKNTATFDGVGAVKIGMTTAQASRALGVRVARDEAMYRDNKECYYAKAGGAYRDLGFMMNGQRIVRIDIDSKGFATDKGAKNGDTEARIKQLYRGLYKVSPHKYVDEGHYIEIANRSKKYTILFETDGKRVTGFRVGLTEPVGYVEGCS